MHIKEGLKERHTLSVTVTNEPGVLARIAGMFTARGYNIESLTVADITEDDSISRITIVTTGTPAVIEPRRGRADRHCRHGPREGRCLKFYTNRHPELVSGSMSA